MCIRDRLRRAARPQRLPQLPVPWPADPEAVPAAQHLDVLQRAAPEPVHGLLAGEVRRTPGLARPGASGVTDDPPAIRGLVSAVVSERGQGGRAPAQDRGVDPDARTEDADLG